MDALKELKKRPLPRIAGYRTCALLGRGGMGEVYAATDEESGLIVAIKVLRSDANGDAISRFDRECRILARFNHPHIARLLGHGVTEDHLPYLVMEYVEGQPILDYCESHGLELRARLKLFHQVCLAVAVAHELHIVHRDLKPANILVTARGEPKLLDFGIAKRTHDSTRELTATGYRLLTPGYASIEQLRGGTVTPASDVYSLGVILKELSPGPEEPGLRRVVEKSMAERPADRYSSAAQLADDIEAYLEGKPMRAHSHRRRFTLAGAAVAIVLIGISMSAHELAERRQAIPSASERDYLVARHLWNKLSPKGLEKAESWFRKAVERDPRSALAHAGLADVFYFRGELGSLPPREAFTQARAEAEKAIELDPSLPLGHVVLASSLLAADLRWREAERGLKKALALDPRCIRALQAYGCLLMRSGRLDEARIVVQRGRLLDPASPILGMLEGRISYYSRDYERAVRELRAVVDHEPGFHLAHYFLGLSYGYLGRVSEAEAELQVAGLGREELQSHVAWVRARNGSEEMAKKVLGSGVGGGGTLFLAAQAGRFDRAFEMLDDALDRGLPVILSLRADPRFDALRADARFSNLLRRTERESLSGRRNIVFANH